MARQYSNVNPPNGGVECRWCRQKSQFWANIWFHRQVHAAVNTMSSDHRAASLLWHFTSRKRRCLLMAGKGGETFMTGSFNVTPKTTEQHLIAHSDISVAYVTNNKRLCSTFCTIEANCWQTWRIARPLCDSRVRPTCNYKSQRGRAMRRVCQ